MPDPAAPILWQFSLSTVNAIIWLVMLALALWMGLRMRWGKLLAVTAFLTLDLIAFGAFVRLTDSGLGCPDWPGCYGQMLPATATTQINAAIAEQGGTHGQPFTLISCASWMKVSMIVDIWIDASRWVAASLVASPVTSTPSWMRRRSTSIAS